MKRPIQRNMPLARIESYITIGAIHKSREIFVVVGVSSIQENVWIVVIRSLSIYMVYGRLGFQRSEHNYNFEYFFQQTARTQLLLF